MVEAASAAVGLSVATWPAASYVTAAGTVAPAGSRRRTVLALTVEAVSASLKVAVTLSDAATPVAARPGETAVTRGAVVSGPAAPVSSTTSTQ